MGFQAFKQEVFWSESPSLASEIPPAVQRLGAYLAAWILLLLISLGVWSRGWSDRDGRELGWLLLLKDKHGLGESRAGSGSSCRDRQEKLRGGGGGGGVTGSRAYSVP